MTDARVPRNTTDAINNDHAEALLFLGTALTGGASAAVEAQEAAGQREMVNATVIPTQVLRSTEDDLAEVGFTLGPVVDGDPLFREATLPAGWKREGSDHNMWSYIVDQLGRRRCSVFYKAAFYDRKAHISVTSVAGYIADCVYSNATPILDDTWATREAVLAAIEEGASEARKRVEFWAGQGESKFEQEEREKAAKYETLRAQVGELA